MAIFSFIVSGLPVLFKMVSPALNYTCRLFSTKILVILQIFNPPEIYFYILCKTEDWFNYMAYVVDRNQWYQYPLLYVCLNYNLIMYKNIHKFWD